MIYLIAAFVLWKFDAGFIWWIGYGLVVAMQSYAIFYNAKKDLSKEASALLKPNGQPYTQDDLEFIWKHGYQSAVEVINSTKQ